MGKWSDLPADLLYAIEDHLVLYIDKIRIRTVNSEWNSYLPKLPDHRKTPFLLHPVDDDEEATHGLFNPLDNKIYKIYFPEACVKIFKGSSYGWIITVEDFHSTTHTDICLINPITRDQIKLLPRTEFPDVIRYSPDNKNKEYTIRSYLDHAESDGDFDEDYVDERTMRQDYMMYSMTLKVVLSCAPDQDECMAIAIYGERGQLAWCKINDKDKKWTHIYTGGLCNIIDILYSKNCLYALCEQYEEGRVFIFENIGTELDVKFNEITTDRMSVPIPRSAYLAEDSDGNLNVVVRHFFYDENLDDYLTRTKEFKVYKLSDEHEHKQERKQEEDSICDYLFREWPSISNSSWVEVKNIGDDVLFVGFGSVWPISSLNIAGCKRNRIYFSDSCSVKGTFDDNKKEKTDVGVFNLEDGTLEPLQGSSYGWIVTAEDVHSTNPNDICLINPVTRAQIKLLPKTEFPDVVHYSLDKVGEEFTLRSCLDIENDGDFDEDYVDELTMRQNFMMYFIIVKVVLSCAPNHDECVVIATYGNRCQLAWCKINDSEKRWTHIYTGGLCNFIDILYSKSCVYALTENFEEGQVFMLENIGTKLDIKVIEITTDRIPVPKPSSAYLAECSDGSLIVVVRHFLDEKSEDSYLIRTKEFKVYKLSHGLERKRKPSSFSISIFGERPLDSLSWVEVNSIGEDVLFVGFGSVRPVPSSNFVGCKRNHIYFSDSDRLKDSYEENKNEKCDIGVFKLEDGTLEPLQGLSDFIIWPRPVWTNIC